MKFLNLKLRRDILKNWTQFFSVFLMAFLSVLVFVGMQGAWRGLEVSLENFIDSSSLADSWVQSTGFKDEDIQKIKQIGGMKQVSEKTRINVSVLGDSKQKKYLLVDTLDNLITKPYLVDGNKTSVNSTDGIWLNKEYAEKNNIHVDDKIEVDYGNQKIPLKVSGIIQSADRIYFTGTAEFIAPNYANYGYGLISEKTLKNKFHYQGLPTIIEVKGADKTLRKKAEKILGNRFIAYYNQATLVDVSDALDRVGQIQNLSFLFSFIFILLAILAMYTTIRRLIETQTKEIAVLKALGFSNRSIGVHYGSFGLLIGGSGAVMGAIVSPLISLFVLETQKSMFSIPEWKISYSYSSLVTILLVISVCILSAFLASREAISGLPALFLRGGTEKRGKSILLEKFAALWSKLRFENRWAIRDAAINKARMMMGIIGVAGGMMLLTAGFGMPESINHLVDKAYNEDFSYDKRIEVSNYEESKEKYDGQGVQIFPARYSPDDGYNRLLIVIGKGNYIHMKTADGKAISEKGIYVTKGFADRAKLKKGDQLKVSAALDDKEYSFKIAGIIISETNQGAYITQKTWENAGGKFNTRTLLVGKGISTVDIKSDENIDSVIQMKDQKQNAYDFVESLMSIFLMIIVFAILLVVVVLYNLGSLNFVERTRDYATLRVLGFHKKELRNITMVENIITTFVGWVLGIPLGLWFLNQYVQTFSTIRIEYISYISYRNLGLASLVVWICSLSTTFFISRRIQKLDMVEALKGVE